jgi:hypothetical protein
LDLIDIPEIVLNKKYGLVSLIKTKPYRLMRQTFSNLIEDTVFANLIVIIQNNKGLVITYYFLLRNFTDFQVATGLRMAN